jgi:hypothetical protein
LHSLFIFFQFFSVFKNYIEYYHVFDHNINVNKNSLNNSDCNNNIYSNFIYTYNNNYNNNNYNNYGNNKNVNKNNYLNFFEILRTENKNNNLNLYSLKINSEFYLTNLTAKKLKFVNLNNLYFYLLSFSQNSIKQNKLKKHLYDILKSIFLTINIDSIYCIEIIENFNIFCEVIVVKNITSNDLKIENNVDENIIKKKN